MRLTVAITGLLLMLAVVSVQAQHGQMMGPMMMGHYDAKAEITIKGTVENVERHGPADMPNMGGIHLLVKTADETLKVFLGPARFVVKTMTFKEGDAVELVGIKMPMMGETAFIAREVKMGDKVLKLRDENGMPLWPRMHGHHS